MNISVTDHAVLASHGSRSRPQWHPSVEVDGAKLALAEGTAHKRLSHLIDVIVLLHEGLVDGEASEAEVVQGSQGLLLVVAAFSFDLLEVKLLGRLDIDADHALVQQTASSIAISHILVTSDLLGHHLNGLLRLGAGVDKDVLGADDGSLWLDAKDVTGDLVAELDPASLKTEEGNVASLLLRGLALNRDLEGLIGLDLSPECNNLGVDVVTTGLDQLGSGGPGSFTIVTHPPRLAEQVASHYLMLLWEALLDEAS